MRSFIERVPIDRYFNRQIALWKELTSDGWNVTVLLVLPRRNVAIAFGWKDDKPHER